VWAVLGVKPGVTPAELKAAYRRRVLEHHPDQGGNAEALRRVLAAYDEALRRLRLPARKPRNEAG
jgi:curved DNA-binding protein CbpA